MLFPKMLPSSLIQITNPMTSSAKLPGQTNGYDHLSLDVPSTPEDDVDVVSININDKKYYCQRCLNHGESHPRKGHKPFCQYAVCTCKECSMVEQRRRLNYELSQAKKDPNDGKKDLNGKRVRDPKCARCSAHGEKHALRGHKRASCPYVNCECRLCGLVENRRKLMAEQIKLRRYQQKAKKELKDQEQKQRSSVENCSPPAGTSNPMLLSNFNSIPAFQFQPSANFITTMESKFPVQISQEAMLRNFIVASQAGDGGLSIVGPNLSSLPNLQNLNQEQMKLFLQMMSTMNQFKNDGPSITTMPALPSPTVSSTEILPSPIPHVVNGCGVPHSFFNVNTGTIMEPLKMSATSPVTPVLPQPQVLLSWPGIGVIQLPPQPNIATLFQQFSSSFLTPPMTPPNNSLIPPNTLF